MFFLDPSFLWALAGFFLIGAEFFVPGLVIIFFGLGALVTALLSAVVPGLDTGYAMQAVIWMASSVASLVSLRRTFGRIFKGKLLPDKRMEEGPMGDTAVVIQSISPDKPGRVKYQGTSWSAVSYTETLDPGEEVTILGQENLTFIVTKSILDNPDLGTDDSGGSGSDPYTDE